MEGVSEGARDEHTEAPAAPTHGALAPILDVRTEVSWLTDGSYRFVGGEPMTMLRLDGQAFSRPPLGIGLLGISDRIAEAFYARGLAHPTPIAYRGPYRLDESSSLAHLSIVVPVKDDHEGVRALAESLGPIRARGASMIVVDDGSATPLRGADLGDAETVQIVRHDRTRGPAAARNAGIALAEQRGATEVMLLDADTVVSGSGWLALLRLHFARPDVCMVAPRIVAAEPGTRGVRGFETARSALDMGAHPARVAPRTSVPYVPSAALLLHLPRLRELLGEGDLFAAGMHVAEDVDLCWRVLRAGGEIRYEPVAHVAHTHRLGLVAMLRRRMFYGEGASRLARDHEAEIVPAIFSTRTLIAAAGFWWFRPWSLALAAAMTVWSAASVHNTLGGSKRLTARIVIKSQANSVWQLASAVLRPYAPATLAVLAATSTSSIGRRGARIVAVAAVAEGVRHWWRQRPPQGRPVNDLPSHLLLHRADDLAYGLGVWKSVLAERSPRALRPELRR
ncbi:putative 55.3 kDa protein in thcA 5'region [Dietzia timorensis]|uniref:Putative 55.3 kDa protein in thcA 5'region n=1 Tax=Dietzia timorensis TaxID=499555 RepID=A0A173LLB4_9ACTN|nr:putative 55.3 kDa protein in thcA 5'region [Dietzia timorensis]